MRDNNIQIKKFNIKTDLKNLEDYLRNEYLEHKKLTSWPPQRLHELVYRMSEFEIEKGIPKSVDYVCLFMKEKEIVGCILPEANFLYTSLKNGYENLYEEMIEFAQEHCKPLCQVNNRLYDFFVVESDCFEYKKEILKKLGYKMEQEINCYNCAYPQQANIKINLPGGFRLCYGDDYKDEKKKWTALCMASYPKYDVPGFEYKTNTYNVRKQSSMYKDSFECLVIDENTNEENNVASYCFVYVDKETKTACIEPVGTREKYRHKGLGVAMMQGVILKCKEKGVEKCYVYSFDWRSKFYNAAGFTTENIERIWRKGN